MPRTRSATGSTTHRINYNENSDLEPNLAMMKSKKKQETKRNSLGAISKQCHPSSSSSNKTENKNQSKIKKGNKRVKLNTSAMISLDSDDEDIIDSNILEAHSNKIKSKIDNFFKPLHSDDEDDIDCNVKIKKSFCEPVQCKEKHFYTLSSDSDVEPDPKEKPSASASTLKFSSEHSLNEISKPLNSHSKSAENNPEDLFNFVDNILNECTVVDTTKSKKNNSMKSSDFKKKTDEILRDVESLIDSVKPEVKKTEPALSKPSSCQICFEPFSGKKRIMSTLCGHIFCEPCIKQISRISKKCPTCRKSLTKAKYHPVYI